MSALSVLALAVDARADCGEFLLGSSPLSEKIYRGSLTQTTLPIAGVLPEEVLAILGRDSASVDLFKILVSELKIKSVRWGSKFRIKGGRFSERLLVMKRIDFSTEAKRQQYWLEFAQALFAEKQRQLKFAGPSNYLTDLTAFSEKLGVLTGETEPGRINYVTYGLRAIIGWMPKGRQFPSTKPRLGIHYTVTRLVAALWISTLAVNVAHIPKAIDTIQTLGQMQDVAWNVVEEFTGGLPIDPLDDRIIIIEKYEKRLAELTAKVIEADPGDVEEINESIAFYEKTIAELKADIAKIRAGQKPS